MWVPEELKAEGIKSGSQCACVLYECVRFANTVLNNIGYFLRIF